MEDAILDEASGQIQKLMIGLSMGNRKPYETKVDIIKCRKDAQALLDGGEKVRTGPLLLWTSAQFPCTVILEREDTRVELGKLGF